MDRARRIILGLSVALAAVSIASAAIIQRKDADLKAARSPAHHRHADVRLFMIRAALDDAAEPAIVILGDSITEMARFPEAACGHPIVAGGIGGASTGDFFRFAPAIFDGKKNPYMIVLATGANDIGSADIGLQALLRKLADFTPHLVVASSTNNPAIRDMQRSGAAAASVPFVETAVTGLMFDRVHYTAAGFRQWLPPILAAVNAACD